MSKGFVESFSIISIASENLQACKFCIDSVVDICVTALLVNPLMSTSPFL